VLLVLLDCIYRFVIGQGVWAGFVFVLETYIMEWHYRGLEQFCMVRAL